MAERDDLASLLEHLVSEGMLDSGGQFTLDSRRALEKARALRFADPGQYLRCLYRGAVLGEASEVNVTVDSDDTVLRFDGPPLSQHQLRYLLASLFVDDPSYCARKLQQLALGVHGAWAQGFAYAEIHSQGVAYRYLPDLPEPVAVDGGLLEQANEIRLKRKFGAEVVKRYLGKKFAEEAVFVKGQGWSAVTTTYNGREMARNRCRQSQFRVDTGLPRSLNLVGWHSARRLELPGADMEFSVVFDINIQKSGAFSLIVADVDIAQEFPLPDCPGMDAMVAVGPFLLDASQVLPVQNDEFRRLVAYLRLIWAIGVVEACWSARRQAEYAGCLPMALATFQQLDLPATRAAQERAWQVCLLPDLAGERVSLQQAQQAGRVVLGLPWLRCADELNLHPDALLLLQAAEIEVADDLEIASPSLLLTQQDYKSALQVDFGAINRFGESLYLPLPGELDESICFQPESRRLLWVEGGNVLRDHPFAGVELLAEERLDRLFLVILVEGQRWSFYQLMTSEARDHLENLLRSSQLPFRFSWME